MIYGDDGFPRSGKTVDVTCRMLKVFDRGGKIGSAHRVHFPVGDWTDHLSVDKLMKSRVLSEGPLVDHKNPVWHGTLPNGRVVPGVLEKYEYGGKTYNVIPSRYAGDAKWVPTVVIDLPDLIDMDTGQRRMDITGYAIGIPDAQGWFESRGGGSGSKQFKLAVSYFPQQSGKAHNSIHWDTANWTGCDLRLRDNTNYRIFPYSYLPLDHELRYYVIERGTFFSFDYTIPEDVALKVGACYDTEEYMKMWMAGL